MKVKICGVKDLETALETVRAGATHIGFNFFEKSPRYITPENAKLIADKIRGKIKIVAVTVKPADELLDEIIKAIDPDYIQLHGSENLTRVSQIAIKTGKKIIKAIPVFDENDIESATKFLESDKYIADYILFDAKPPKNSEIPGGNAVSFNWKIIPAVLPHLFHKPKWILSGGLTPENVKTAILASGADFVDVASGVESSRGVKDINLIKKFVFEAKKTPRP